MEPFGIALVGCGTVGGGVARLLLEHKDRLAARAGRQLVLRRVVVRDPHKPRAAADGAAADQGNAERFHERRWMPPGQAGRPSAARPLLKHYLIGRPGATPAAGHFRLARLLPRVQ
jgi:homoserine dehydrogenase